MTYPLSNTALWLVILAMFLATFPFRAMPFLLYRKLKNNRTLKMLGRKLPPVMMLLLVLYCLKDALIQPGKDLIFQAISLAVVAVLQWKWKHVLLSIGAGLGLYLLLVNNLA